MDPFIVLNVQTTLSLIAFALIAKWHIAPRLSKLPLQEALVPLLWIHVFRYTPLTLFLPGQVSSDIPTDVLAAIAYGDLISGVLALAAILMLKYRVAGAIVVVWIFNIVGVADIINALLEGVGAQLYQNPLGFNWYILAFYVPMLIVTHAMMIYWLIKRRSVSPA